MLKQWLRKREEAKDRNAFESGYGWACTEMLHKGTSEEEVEAFIFGSGSAFDSGARHALIDIGTVRQHIKEAGRILGE